MNTVILQGNLTHDPELRYVTPNDKKVAVCNFSIATHRHFKKANGDKHKETTFVDCETWDTGAETIAKYVTKGDSLLVRGSLKNDTWEKDGKRISKLRVRVEEFELPPRSRQDDTITNTENPESGTPNGDDIPF